MTLSVAAVMRPKSAEISDVAAAGDVNLFDLYVWNNAGALETSLPDASASDVAKEVYLRASLTQRTQSTETRTLCFRYGPRPPPHMDSFLFHARCYNTREGRSNAPSLTSLPLMGGPSPPIHPSRLFSSDNPVAYVSRWANEYDSLLALWLEELLSEPDSIITVTALLLFVEGTAVDLATGSKLHTTLKVDSGTAKPLHNRGDATKFLQSCEAAIHDSVAVSPRCPYHVCITVYADTLGGQRGGSIITFLDVAPPALESDDVYAPVLFGEQLSLFAQQLGIKATATTTLPTGPLTPDGANNCWLDFLNSLQLSCAHVLGLVYTPRETPQSLPHCVKAASDDCDRLSLARALRQRGLRRPAKDGVLLPSLPPLRGRATARHVKTTAGAIIANLNTPDPLVSVRFRRRRPQQHNEKPSHLQHITSALRGFDALGDCAPNAERLRIPLGDVPHRDRFAGLLRHMELEEHHSRLVLSGAEQRARSLAEIRWALRVQPPGKCIDAVSQCFAQPVRRRNRCEQHLLGYSNPTAHLPSLLGKVKPSLSVPHPPAKPAQRSSILAQPAPSPHRSSETDLRSWRIGSPSPYCATGTPRECQGGPQAQCASPHATARTDPAVVPRHRNLTPRWLPFAKRGIPHTRSYSPPHRCTASEVALITRQRAADRYASPIRSSRKGKVVRLYPLVHARHVMINEQDTFMAKEFMMRSHIEDKEKNRRQALSAAHVASVHQLAAPWSSESPTHQPNTPLPVRQSSMKPRSRRIFFTC